MPYVSGIGAPLQDQALLAVGARLQELWNPELLLITLGSEGMLLFDRNGASPVVIDTVAQHVFDVSGAGDTVMATMTLALAAGASPETAARIANQAAGIVVGYVGTRAVAAAELLERLEEAEK
jgi:D-beta-D-heptose 7-phosphate kinase/D-beta-D-heptose 1-phosphate adenosyltransferase